VGIDGELMEIWPNEVCDIPVALQSRRALMEWSSLVFVVPIATGRSREVLHTSKVLIEKSLGSLFSYLGLRSRARTMSQTSFGHISTNSLTISTVLSSA